MMFTGQWRHVFAEWRHCTRLGGGSWNWHVLEKVTFSKTLMVLLVHWGKNKKCAKFHDEKRFSSLSTTTNIVKNTFGLRQIFLSLAASTRLLPHIDKKLSPKMAKSIKDMKNENSLLWQNQCMLVLSTLRQNHSCVWLCQKRLWHWKANTFVALRRAINCNGLPLFRPAEVAKMWSIELLWMTSLLTSWRLGI